MANEVTLTAIFENVEDGWVQGRIREIPGVVTAAPTRQEAEVDLKDALLEYLATFSEPLEDNDQAESQGLRLTVT